MEALKIKVAALLQELETTTITSADALEQYRIKYLGTKGIVKDIFGMMKDVDGPSKKEAGQLLNKLKQAAEAVYTAHEHLKNNSSGSSAQKIDATMPGVPVNLGTRHPLKIVENQIISIFEKLGFVVAEGPEVEDDWHNFTALNMPEDHTARDMQDTFYVAQNPDWLLRTHTSSVQARVLQEGTLPVRIICPGRVYRNETISARAHCFFHQCEGLYVDKKVSFADLKQTLYFFVKEMFGENTKVRFRPSYFPFTEPSAEMDISCSVCNGDGCSLCKQTGWVEILGCGMVHPNLLKNFGIDPEVYSGFAFGMGVERITQLKYSVNDLRLYSQNDIRFLKQFESVLP